VNAKRPSPGWPVRGSRFLLLAALFGWTALAVSPLLAAAENLLANPSFELGMAGWTAMDSDRGRSRIVPAAARSGALGLLVDDRSAAEGGDLFSERMEAYSGSGYELSFWVQARAGDGLAVYLNFYDAAGIRLHPAEHFQRFAPEPSEGWVRRILPAIAPPGTASMAVRVMSFNHARIEAWLDDFVLREVPLGELSASAGTREMVSLNFPKPDARGAFAEQKLFQPDGHPYRTAIEDWAGARHRTSEVREWQVWLAGEQAKVDGWIARHRDRAEWRAGWWHNFVDPADGSFLVWDESIPGEEAPTVKARSGREVEVTPAIMGGWIYGFRGRHIAMANVSARLGLLTGERRYIDWAAAQLDFYAESYLDWSVENGARMGGQSLEEAIWLIRLVDTARLLLGRVDAERSRNWIERLFRPQAALLDDSFQIIHNIATWHRSASAHVALLAGDQAYWDRQMNGPFGLRQQLRRGVTGDWFWYEQSMGYNDYIMHAVHPLLLLAALLGERDRLLEEAAIVQNLLMAPLAVRFPDGRLPNPADSTSRLRAPSVWFRDGYRVLPTPIGLGQAIGTFSWDTLLDPPERISAAHQGATTASVPAADHGLPVVSSLDMSSSRVAQLKKGRWQVFFHYGQLARSHSQAEALNWSASFDDVMVTDDPGTVGYASPLHRGYFTQGLNHNVPLIDGRGQQPWRTGSLVVFDPENGVMTAEQPDYRCDVRARRTLRIVGDRLVDEVEVELKDTDALAATFGLAFHVKGRALLPRRFQELLPEVFAEGRSAAFSHWSGISMAEFVDDAELEVELEDGTRLGLRFSTPGPFALYHGASPDTPPPATRTGFYLERIERSAEATFTMEIEPAS
jgi:oligo-alginate lyase